MNISDCILMTQETVVLVNEGGFVVAPKALPVESIIEIIEDGFWGLPLSW